ncbi:MAG: transposase [Prevotellaceae bacterium]|jgi:REP element-mobilizing transposase RayT|nr:transposase [Prevotellaceae bacterium]
MTKYNPDIHHRRSIRLQGYDYSQAGLYFITICVKNGEWLFGEVVDGKMVLNECGEIAEMLWNELPKQFANVLTNEFVVMPNHIHGIIEILDTQSDVRRGAGRGAINRAPTTATPTNINGGFAHEKNPMFYENLPRIVRWLKGRITFECRKTNVCFAWQRNYYENIIRDRIAHENIIEYIQYNPIRWEFDRFYNN